MNTKLIIITMTLSIGLLMSKAGVADVYDKGHLNVECHCGAYNVSRYKWHHDFDVPRNGVELDLNEVCRYSVNNYDGPDAICKSTDSFWGKEYAFDPE